MREETRLIRAAAVAAILLVLATVAVYLKGNPFAEGYEIKGVFRSAGQLESGDEVRLAGIPVGHVSAIEDGPRHTAVVTMQIEDSGRPVRADAALAIEPRLLLEGNDAVKLSPGTPGKAELPSGAVIPESRTKGYVQLDEVLGVFDLPGRNALHRSVRELAGGYGDAAGTGTTGAQGMRRAARELDRALESTREVARGMRGTEPGDLTRAIDSTGEFTSQMARDPRALADMITNFNRFAGALAAEDRNLAATIRGLNDVLGEAPPSLRSLDRALPRVTTFANGLRPAMRETVPAMRSGNRLLGQLQALMRRRELPSLLDRAEPVLAEFPRFARRASEMLPLVTAVAECISNTVVPTLNQKIEDGPNTTGDPVWLDLMHFGTSVAAGSPGFDGNGTTFRLGVSTGESAIQGVLPGLGRVVMGGPEIQGVRPGWLGYNVEPPWRPDAWCKDQAVPDLTKRSEGPPVLPQAKRVPIPKRGAP